MTGQPFDLDAFLAQRAAAREAAAIVVDAELHIRRGAARPAPGVYDTDDDRRWLVDIWDDDYATTLVLTAATVRPELLRGLFLDRKAAAS